MTHYKRQCDASRLPVRLYKRVVTVVTVTPIIVVLYLASLGPALAMGERIGAPEAIWYVYYPVFYVWGSGAVPRAVEVLYYERYLQMWTEWLPYKFLSKNDLI